MTEHFCFRFEQFRESKKKIQSFIKYPEEANFIDQKLDVFGFKSNWSTSNSVLSGNKSLVWFI